MEMEVETAMVMFMDPAMDMNLDTAMDLAMDPDMDLDLDLDMVMDLDMELDLEKAGDQEMEEYKMKIRPRSGYCTAKKLPDLKTGAIIKLGKTDKSRVEIIDVCDEWKSDIATGDIAWLPTSKTKTKVTEDIILIKCDYILGIEE